MNKIKIGSDFSGVGAFNQALKRLGIDYEEVFACDMDKYARQTFIHNYGEPKYYPENVYDREVPKESLDIYMTSPPCQAFSLAGNRKGEQDKRGVLFYNSHDFIKKNKPRFFIFENVKGLLSDDNGKTFARWIDYLGGKSVNGNPVIFPHEDSVPYHVYHKVLNAKNYGVPQNRERVFIIGIRDDIDNNFLFPKEIPLTKRLKDILENEVDEKYYLSYKMIQGLTGINTEGVSRAIRVGGRSSKSDKHNWDLIKVGYINQDTQASQVYSEIGISQTLCAGTHGYANGYVKIKPEINIVDNLPGKHEQNSRIYGIDGICPTLTTMQGGGQEPKIKIKSATSKGYELAEIGEDSINLEHPNSETRRGRIGKSVAQTLTTSCNQGVAIGTIRGRNPDNPKSRKSGLETEQMLEINKNNVSNCLTTVQKDNVVIQINPSKESGGKQPYQHNRVYDSNGIMTTLDTECGRPQVTTKDYRIRKLTPRECFRLMGFPYDFDFSCVSDSQAYKQAGNSIVVDVLEALIKRLKL